MGFVQDLPTIICHTILATLLWQCLSYNCLHADSHAPQLGLHVICDDGIIQKVVYRIRHYKISGFALGFTQLDNVRIKHDNAKRITIFIK